MSHFIQQLSHSRLEKLLFTFFVVSLFVFAVAGLDFLLSFSSATAQEWEFWREGGVRSLALGLGGSICVGYGFHILARLSQKIRFESLAAQQFQVASQRLDSILSSLLLSKPQQQDNLPPSYELMMDNISEAPFMENALQPSSAEGEASLPIRIDMVEHFDKHVTLMESVASQLMQLQALTGKWKTPQNDQINQLLQLLQSFDSTLLLHTQQEKWAKLHNAYYPLCQYLAQR